jgi:hypothetical protein
MQILNQSNSMGFKKAKEMNFDMLDYKNNEE